MGHTYTNILLHVVFSTKNRAPILRAEIRARLFEYLAGIAREEFGRALAINCVDDHLHGLLSIRPDVAISAAVGKWKSLSSRWLHTSFPGYANFAWQEGYAAFSVSQSASEDVRNYIARQEEHHRKMTFEEELRAMLERNGVEYDPKYLLG